MDKNKAKRITETLSLNFSDKPALKFSTPYQLLIAVILSAQCTDARVNKVTSVLFEKYDTPQKISSLTAEELEKYIFSCGLYRSKAKHILEATEDIINKFGGEVPQTLEELRSLSGVGRKTANVVYSVAFGKDAIAVDTHVFRVAKRIGLAEGKTPLAVENGLMEILDKIDWKRAHHYLIYLGRSFCKAGKPNCSDCPINTQCERKL